SLQISSIAPFPPINFVGRDDLVQQGLDHISRKSPAHIAILGPGGIGKTSLALAILNHEKARNIFNNHCYFIPCEIFTTGLDLSIAILQVLGGSFLGQEQDVLSLLRQRLSQTGDMLLVIDNFETLWLENSSVAEVKRILEIIASTESITLILTMRGDMPPRCIEWSIILPPEGLGPLTIDAAKEMYLNGKQVDSQDESILEKLLVETDCVPLAVSLLSALGNVYPISNLYDRWTRNKTQLLKVRDGGGQLTKSTSVAISINLSLESFQNADASRLLFLIAYLPEGFPHWIQLLESITNLEDPYDAVDILSNTGLTYKTSNKTLTMLSPTRHYINTREKPNKAQFEADLQHIIDFINNSVKKNSDNLSLFGSANITTIFADFVKSNPTLEHTQSALKCSQYLAGQNIYLINLVETLISVIEKLGSQEMLGESVMHYRDMLLALASWSKAEQETIHAYEIYKKLGDKLKMAQNLQSLGHGLKMEGKFVEASRKHEEAYTIFKDLNNQPGMANALKALGLSLRLQNRFKEASAKLTDAYKIYEELQDTKGMAFVLKAIGNILRSRKQYEEALEKHKEAYSMFTKRKHKVGMADSLHCIGDDLRLLDRPDEAAKKHLEAYEHYKDLKNDLGMAEALDSLGDDLRIMEKYEEALKKHEVAYQTFSKLQNKRSMGNSLNSMGDVFRMQEKYTEAIKKYTEAYEIFEQLENKLKMAKILKNLGDALEMDGKKAEGAGMHKASQELFHEVENVN
ncbi:hypothetical protein BDQ12DRAFT_615326, partial [Crucibulum laeve]